MILIVDDDDSIGQMLSDTFSEFAPTLVLRNGEAACRYLTDEQPVTVMVTDLRMPDMDGVDLIQQIKKMGYDFPIFVFSGHPNLVELLVSEGFPEDDVFSKPFDLDELVEAVQQIIPN